MKAIIDIPGKLAVGATGTITITELDPPKPVSVWDQWPNGPKQFPIIIPWAGVSQYAAYKAIGVTHLLYPKADPTNISQAKIDAARTHGLKVIVGYSPYALQFHADVVDGWFVEPDEPDGVGAGSRTPKASGPTINERIDTIRAADPTRPIHLSLSMGVAWPGYIGRGTDTGKIEPYSNPDGYCAEADCISFNCYPGSNTSTAHAFIHQNWALSTVGMSNLRGWTVRAAQDPDRKVFYQYIEACPVRGLPPNGREPRNFEMVEQARLSIAAGARALGFFPHSMQPGKPDWDHGIENPYYRSAMADIIATVKATVA